MLGPVDDGHPALALPGAAAAEVIQTLADPAGDVTAPGTGPDIRSTVVEFVDGDPTTAADDLLRVTTDVASPFVGGDRLFWRIDADQNPATGEVGTGDEATARFDLLFAGPELQFFYYNPVRPAERFSAPAATPTRYTWQKGLAALGLARGGTSAPASTASARATSRSTTRRARPTPRPASR